MWKPLVLGASGASCGGQIKPPDGPGGVKIDPWRAPGGSWKLLSSSGELRGVVAGVVEGSRGLLGGVLVCLGAVLGSSWRLLGPSWEPIKLGAKRAPKGCPRGLEMELPVGSCGTLIFDNI